MEFIIDELGDEKRYLLIDLLDRTTYSEEAKRIHIIEINNMMMYHEFDKMMLKIQMNLIQDKDRIAFGLNYSQTDIKKRLKRYEDNTFD